MDDILAKAGSQAVTFAIKSGISIASTYALRTITKFVIQIPKSDARRIEQQKAKLENRIAIVTSAIDLIKLVAARGNTNLESTLRLTKDLKNELDSFDERMRELITKVEESRSAKSQKEAIDSVELYINDLLQRIEEVTPFINLSLTTSGANLNSSLPQQVSPGLLLKASNYINSSNGKPAGQVGPAFEISLYSVFYHLDKANSSSNVRVDWKEDMKKAFVRVVRIESSESSYNYQLLIEQSFDDGRYHNFEEEKLQKLTVNLRSIVKLFFSVSGNLLKLAEQENPVLVLKVDKNIAGEHPETSMEDIAWYAFGQYDGVEDEEEEEEAEEGEEEGEGPDEYKDREKQEEKELTEKQKDGSGTSSSIALLEYIIRLASLQESDNQSILEVSDERLSVYLNDENPNSIREKKANVDQVTHGLSKVTLD
ncbi:hypothetical protein HG536_0B05880 [Torulaspora globosa]|uniref:Ran-specific GTPase-activating protein 30 n=1 Tax=Torulaspora globosa TaxID=48254 RepID=A0A7G3ZDY6_9SACH|nr:uncharacterized protein HG536_0B05880 [Torulaspora globosa]QLL31722.1 hypothetical protein HG536_0B05880 [Torulaspora globosa]